MLEFTFIILKKRRYDSFDFDGNNPYAKGSTKLEFPFFPSNTKTCGKTHGAIENDPSQKVCCICCIHSWVRSRPNIIILINLKFKFQYYH